MTEPGTHSTAEIGNPPEWRDWKPDDLIWEPDIDKTARVNAFVTVDAGVNDSTYIGPHTFVMAHCHIGHDAFIGAESELAPGARIGGFVFIGERVKVGMNAVVLPSITVGDGARIGAGAIVTKDIPAGETWVGNPAQLIERDTAERRSLTRHTEAEESWAATLPG